MFRDAGDGAHTGEVVLGCFGAELDMKFFLGFLVWFWD